MRWTSRCALLSVGTMVMVASAAAAQARPGKNGNGIKVRKDRYEMPAANGTVSTTTTVYVKGETKTITDEWNIKLTPFDINAYASMAEPNILAHMAGVASLRIQLAAIGHSKLTDPRAKEFVARQASEDDAHLIKLQEIATDENVGAKPLVTDPEVTRLREAIWKYQRMPAGRAFDASFLRVQFDHNQNELDLLKYNRNNAHDDDFEKFIDQWFPNLSNRRNVALGILVTLQ
jgi:predicted outer membrane protein